MRLVRIVKKSDEARTADKRGEYKNFTGVIKYQDTDIPVYDADFILGKGIEFFEGRCGKGILMGQPYSGSALLRIPRKVKKWSEI